MICKQFISIALQIVLSIPAQPWQVFAILKPLIKSVNLLPFFFIMHDQRGVPGGPSAHLCHMLDPVVSDGVLMEASQYKNSPEGKIKRVAKSAAVKRKLFLFS